MPDKTPKPDWIAVDWGTTSLRAWAMTNAGDMLAEAVSAKGMGTLSRDEFEPALLDLVDPWLSASGASVVACGMVGARQGWLEAPYATVPCIPGAAATVSPVTRDPRLQVHIVPGVKQMSPPDVMRGEETQIAGFLRLYPGYDGILCLPGTHTKWVWISEGQISAFRTSMTGEIFACLAKHSVLRHAVDVKGWSEAAFSEALSDAISRPEQMTTRLFSLRADNLLNGTAPGIGTARLSGTLIGMELASVRGYWLGQNVTLIGAKTISKVYAQALTLQGVEVSLTDAEAVTRAGLFATYETIKEAAK